MGVEVIRGTCCMSSLTSLPPELARCLSPAHPELGSGLVDLRLHRGPRNAQKVDLMEVLDRLPAAAHVRSMLNILRRDQSLVVVGETGSGKSTVLPLFTSAAMPDVDVFCAVPRIFAAERLAGWLSEVCGQPVGRRVGFHTGVSSSTSDETRLTFCTTGVAEMRELLGQNQRRRIVFVDEAHERNCDQDMLLAFLRQEMERNPYLKVVVMSATIQSERFAEYLDGCKVLKIRGRQHQVTQVEPERTLAEDVVKYVRQGLNIQIGLAGKLEIEEAFGEIENALRREGLEAVVLPLHKDVPSAQQQECFRDWGMPRVILATNIAETSLTIPDLHVVIDTGLRRRTYLNNGVQCLGTVYATQFEATQLKGRVGRTQPGIWIDRCDVPLADRPLAPPPEILRLQPTNALLKFKAFQNLDPRDMKLLDDPGVDVWDAAEDDLKQLGLMDSAPQATELGQVIARLPISVNLGRMLVEARQRGVLKEAIYVAAAIEVNGLQDRENSEWRNVVEGLDSDSELMVQLKLFEHATHLTGQLANENDVLERGISYKNFIKAQEHAAELIRRVKLMGWTEVDQYARCRSMENALVSSFMAGFPNCVFVRHGNFYIGLDGEKRRLHGEAVTAADTQFVAGIPWDFDPNIEGMGKPKHFINYASAVSETAAMKLPYVRELLSNQKGKFEERETKMRGAQGKSGLRTHQRQVRRF
jgi:ATP-dependent helicase HrpA